MNLHPDITSARVITRLIGNIKRAAPGEVMLNEARERKRLEKDRDLQENIDQFNTVLEESRQQFLRSPYESLYIALDVLYTELNKGKKLKQPRSRWAFFLPILRQELSYLTTAGLADNPKMKRYVYYITKLMHQIASGTHNKVSKKTVVRTNNPDHRQLLESLIDSGGAAYNMRMKYLYDTEAHLENKIDISFVDILKNHLKEFFPAQEPSRLFKHRLNAYIIFALGAYETYTDALHNNRLRPSVDKYTFINEKISEAINLLASAAGLRDHPSGTGAAYDAPEIIWEGFSIPTLSKSITLELLNKIREVLKNPRLIETIDNRYVKPIFMREGEEKEEDEAERRHPPRLLLGVDPAVSELQVQPLAKVQGSSALAGGSTPPIPGAPPPPRPPVSARPVAPKALGQGVASPSFAERPAVKPSFLDDLTNNALGRTRLKKVEQPATPQDKTKAAAPTGLMGMLSQITVRRQAIVGEENEGKGDEDEDEWNDED